MKQLNAVKCKKCGSKPTLFNMHDKYRCMRYLCYCRKCKHGKSNHTFKTAQEAIQNWNDINKD